MEYSKGEIIDRLAIEMRKSQYGATNGEQIEKLAGALVQYRWSPADVLHVIENALSNSTIAALEWDIREGQQLSDECIGIRARAIREANAWRVRAKNAIDERKGDFVPAFGPGRPADKIKLNPQFSK